MSQRLRFLLDENVAQAVADALRRRGIDVTTTVDARLRSATDEEHVAFAFREQRVIFTQDADFLVIATRGVKHFGIAYCHPESRSIGQIIAALLGLWHHRDCETMRDVVEFI